jgi:hypothetical protein
MSFVPTFKIYATNGSTLIYTFENVQKVQGWPSEQPSNIEITNLRSQGSINIAGGQKSYDIVISGTMVADDYTALTTKILALRDTIVANTNYVLKIDKSSIAVDSINVIRKIPVQFEDSLRTTMQRYTVTLRALAW